MKTWKRIFAVALSVSTMGMTILSSGCDMNALIGGLTGHTSTSQDGSSEGHIHKWQEVILEEATCTTDGKTLMMCVCGEVKGEVIPAGHDLIREVVSEATCTQAGLVELYCKNCEYRGTEIQEPRAHSYLEGEKCFWCGKSKSEIESSQMGEAVAYDGCEVTITFYHTMGKALRDELDIWIAEFNKLYPNITIEHKSQGDYVGLRDSVLSGIASNTLPNLAYCYADHVALYNEYNAVMTLDDYIANVGIVERGDGTFELMGLTQEQSDSFVSVYYEEGRMCDDGKMYMLPLLKSTEVLYYNKTFFEENNLTVPKTWDEMETVMGQIKAIDPYSVPLGYDTESNWFITMCAQLGTPYTSTVEGGKFLFDVEENHSFVQRFRNWYQNGWVTTEGLEGRYTSDLFVRTNPSSRKAYMTIASSAGAYYNCPDPYTNAYGRVEYPFEVGVAQIPQINVDNPKVTFQGPSLCMFKNADSQEMAATWLFMEFLTTTIELQAQFSLFGGYASVIKDLDEKCEPYASMLDVTDGNQNLQMTALKQCIAQENAMFYSPAFIGSAGAREAVGVLMQNCLRNTPKNGQSVADFIKNEFKENIAKLRKFYGE